jgi:hypothetical protein
MATVHGDEFANQRGVRGQLERFECKVKDVAPLALHEEPPGECGKVVDCKSFANVLAHLLKSALDVVALQIECVVQIEDDCGWKFHPIEF